MEQTQNNQSASHPKKHRMTYAEWKKANPRLTPKGKKKVAELGDSVMELIAHWYRSNLATERRKARQAKLQQGTKPTQSKPTRSARSRKTKSR
jgi:hypothetical protein